MKNFLHYGIGPLIAILLVIIKIPYIENKLTYVSEKEPGETYLLRTVRTAVPLGELESSETENSFGYWIIAGILVLGTGLNYWLTIISPYHEQQENKKKRWDEIDGTAEKFVELMRDNTGFDVSLNIMIPSRKFFSRSEPKKISFFPKVFEVVWGYGTHQHVNSRLKFTTNQGACGMAYRREDFFSVDLEKEVEIKDVRTKFNITDEQLELTKDVTMVVCCPILIIKKTVETRKTKIIGVLNLECRMNGLGELLKVEPEMQSLVYENMGRIARLYVTY